MTIKHEEQKAEDEIRGETIGMIQGMLEIKKKEISFSLINVVSWQKKKKGKGKGNKFSFRNWGIWNKANDRENKNKRRTIKKSLATHIDCAPYVSHPHISRT